MGFARICVSRNVRLLQQRTLLALPGLVGVPLQPVVELLLVAVEASLAPPQAVALLTSCQSLLHVALIVEVGHVPSVLLVVVVVGVGGVVAWRDALSVGRRRSVVEVYSVSTMGSLCSRSKRVILWLFDPGGPDADHPDEQNQQDDEDNSASDSSSNVGKL